MAFNELNNVELYIIYQVCGINLNTMEYSEPKVPYVSKRQWGFSYIMTKKTIKRASADVGLIFTVFNLPRLINIIGKNEFKKYLEGLIFLVFFIIESYRNITLNISHLIFQSTFHHPKIKIA